MGRTARRTGISALLAVLLTALVAYGANRGQDQVQALVKKYVALAQTPNATPLSEIGEMLLPDFIQYGSDGSITKGRDANLQGYRAAVQKIEAAFESLTVTFDPLRIDVRGDSAVAIGHVRMVGNLKNGDRPYTRTHRVTLVFQRRHGKWMLFHKHSSVAHPK
jgi:ketosteroid isomerase-like protein